MKIDGRLIAQNILDNLKNKIKKEALSPTLAVILIGEDPASIAYIKQKQKAADYIGAKINNIKFPENVDPLEIVQKIEELNKDVNVQGIIAQLPFPKHLYPRSIQLAVDPHKDVDGFLPTSSFIPPVASAVLKVFNEIEKNSKMKIRDNEILVIGRGRTAGKPIAETLVNNGYKVRVSHSQTAPDQLTALAQTADVIITCVGQPEVIKALQIKKGVILIGVGIYRTPEGKLIGDYNEDEIEKVAAFYTPTPGGIGPINVACLMENLVRASTI